MTTPPTITNERDKSLDSSKKATLIVAISLIAIAALWFITAKLSKNSPYYQ